VLALASDSKGQARAHDAAINDHTAGPADADTATFLGAGEADVIAEDLEKQAIGFYLQIIFFPVDD
jgi:hypothetical protein